MDGHSGRSQIKNLYEVAGVLLAVVCDSFSITRIVVGSISVRAVSIFVGVTLDSRGWSELLFICHLTLLMRSLVKPDVGTNY